jgi:hypothetical protein
MFVSGLGSQASVCALRFVAVVNARRLASATSKRERTNIVCVMMTFASPLAKAVPQRTHCAKLLTTPKDFVEFVPY